MSRPASSHLLTTPSLVSRISSSKDINRCEGRRGGSGRGSHGSVVTTVTSSSCLFFLWGRGLFSDNELLAMKWAGFSFNYYPKAQISWCTEPSAGLFFYLSFFLSLVGVWRTAMFIPNTWLYNKIGTKAQTFTTQQVRLKHSQTSAGVRPLWASNIQAIMT